jgi:hypothetical protein
MDWNSNLWIFFVSHGVWILRKRRRLLFRLDFFFYHGKFETSLFEARGLNRGMGPDNPGGAVGE